MKKLMMLVAGAVLLTACQSADKAEPVAERSLRGDLAITEMGSPVAPQYPAKGQSVPRHFVAQPPVIPHKADHPVSVDKNACVSCHKAGKRKMHESHFEGKQVDGMFYNCRACHVPQVTKAS